MNHRTGARLVALLGGLLSAAIPLLAQTSPATSREKILERIQQLETQLAEIRTEVVRLRGELGQTPGQQSSVAAPRPEPGASSPAGRPPAAGKKQEGFELGPWRAIPYGTVYFNAFANSGGSNNTDLPTFAAVGPGNASASVRQTRLGLRIRGPELGGAETRALVEADFFGGFPSIGVGETFGVVRLRLAYGEMQWQHRRLLLGQDWVIFAPHNPISIASAAIPQLTSAGNLWARLPQVRLDLNGGSRMKWLWQSAVLAPATGDFPVGTAAFLLQPGAGARTRVPYFESRVAGTVENWFGLGHPATFGASAHYGRARVVTSAGNQDSDSVGASVDWNLPVVSRVTLLGEAFFGRNLAGFQGGVFQGINTDFAYRRGAGLVAGGPRAIGTRGGWAQLAWTPPSLKKTTFYGSLGLDVPRRNDLASLAAHDWRLRNQALALGFLHKPIPQLFWGVEYRRLETRYLLSGRTDDHHVNAGVAVSF